MEARVRIDAISKLFGITTYNNKKKMLFVFYKYTSQFDRYIWYQPIWMFENSYVRFMEL